MEQFEEKLTSSTQKIEDIKDAFSIYNTLLQEGIVEQRELLLKYKKSEVKDIVKTFTEESNTVLIEIAEERLYLVRGLDNPYMAYTADDIRKKIATFNATDGNKAIHLIYIIILHVLSEFYDTNSVSYTLGNQFVPVLVIAKKVQETMEYVRTEFEPVIEELSVEYEINLIGAARLLNEYSLGKADSKDPSKTKTIMGVVLRTVDFLVEEGLLTYFDEDNIRITEKMRDLVENYYFNETRKEKLLGLFKKTLKTLKEDSNPNAEREGE